MKKHQRNTLILSSILFCSLFIIVSNLPNTIEHETNYEGLVKLHLAPNSETRDVTDKDKYTGVLLTDGTHSYGLFESRSIERGDYGKTFVVPIK